MKNLSNLRTLYLGANCLSVLPEWLGGFTQLEKRSPFVGLPDSVSKLKMNLLIYSIGV
jgi:hypothetical protein